MKCFLFSAGVFLVACSSQYKGLRKVETDHACVESTRPSGMETNWFDASVDVVGRHISGLLLIKSMPDSAYRVVFTNEVGITFFDFAFSSDGGFESKKVISYIDKGPVINTLKKDFSLLLGLHFRRNVESWVSGNEIFHGVKNDREMFYFVTDTVCSHALRLEMGSKRKRKVSIEFDGESSRRPDEITISHHTFDMVINLKKISAGHD